MMSFFRTAFEALRPTVRRSLAVAAISCFVASPSPGATESTVLDEGRFVVSQKGRNVRAEDFILIRSRDTLFVRFDSRLYHGDTVASAPEKSAQIIMGALDGALGQYRSHEFFRGDTLRYGVEVTPGDTLMTRWREWARRGEAERVAWPPGRVFVLDRPLFTTFNLISRSLHGKVFERRPLTFLILGQRDSMLEMSATDLGSETIRWGDGPVVTRKLMISDQNTPFTVWAGPDGRMLRLETLADIVVERVPPAAKPARPPSPPSRKK